MRHEQRPAISRYRVGYGNNFIRSRAKNSTPQNFSSARAENAEREGGNAKESEVAQCARRFSAVVLKIRYRRINNIGLSELVLASVFTLNCLCIGLALCTCDTAWVVIRDVRNDVNALASAIHMY